MFQDVQNIFVYSLSVSQVIGSITVALICGLLISLFYRWVYKGPGYSMTFVHSIVALAMITAIVIMVIGNNLARAFGLVGAMSIIRFRTAIKDTQDIVFIFFSLAVGMAAGVGLNLIAITGTVFIGIIIVLLSRAHYASPRKREFLLQFSFTSSGEMEAPYLPILKKYGKQDKLIHMKSSGNGDVLELSFYIKLKDTDKSGDLVRELGRLEGVDHVNLFFDEE